MWRRGRAVPVDLLGGLLAMPKRYMVDLHHVVARDRYMANTHVATAGGFVLAAVLAILVHGLGVHNRSSVTPCCVATALMFVGALFVFKRRLNPPSRCPKARGCACRKACWRFPRAFSS
jgi:dimethylglycine catabolism B